MSTGRGAGSGAHRVVLRSTARGTLKQGNLRHEAVEQVQREFIEMLRVENRCRQVTFIEGAAFGETF